MPTKVEQISSAKTQWRPLCPLRCSSRTSPAFTYTSHIRKRNRPAIETKNKQRSPKSTSVRRRLFHSNTMNEVYTNFRTTIMYFPRLLYFPQKRHTVPFLLSSPNLSEFLRLAPNALRPPSDFSLRILSDYSPSTSDRPPTVFFSECSPTCS